MTDHELDPHPLPDSYWVSPGQLLAGPRPTHEERKVQNANIVRLLDAGIRMIIDLTIPGEVPTSRISLERRTPEGEETVYLNFPIRNGGTPNRAFVQSVLDLIDASIARGRPVYFHCLGGLGRTGTIAGCWLIRHGKVEPDDVYDRLSELREGQPHGEHPSPETAGQRRFVRKWKKGQ